MTRSSKCWGHNFWTPPRCACYYLRCNAKSWFVLKFSPREFQVIQCSRGEIIPSSLRGGTLFPAWETGTCKSSPQTMKVVWHPRLLLLGSFQSWDCSVTATVPTVLLTALLAFLAPAFSFYDLIELLWPWHFIINHHCRKCWAKRKLISKVLKAWIFSLAKTSKSWIFPITYTKYDLHLHDLKFSTSPQSLCPSLTSVFHL